MAARPLAPEDPPRDTTASLMNARTIARRLGTEPGTTLTSLVALAETLSPSAPSDAFGALWLYLPWLASDEAAAQMRCYGGPLETCCRSPRPAATAR